MYGRWWKPDAEWDRWAVDPLVGVGPLRFGMAADEVQEAIGAPGPVGAVDEMRAPWWKFHDAAGVSVIYDLGFRLVGVAVDAISGPQLHFAGIPLVGRPLTEVEADLTRRADERDLGLLYDSEDEFGPQDAHLYVLPVQAGDRTISGVRLFEPDWNHRR
ncbi:hypothetical protein [Kitasatospora griseola]|uniref:hypothetical protein n=1 Tax=Kitasatospora griseola TaxID=2064 RepID=UPI0037F8077F